MNPDDLKQISEQRNKKIKKHIKKMRKLYLLPGNDRKNELLSNLIDEASFMFVMLEELKENINKNGITEKYQNGKNQWGIKDSTELKAYNTIIKNYTSVIKQLNDILPEDVPKNPEDEFDAFNGIK